jgi:hypothetical protein
MNIFRLHITRTLSVAALLAGMVFYFLKPVNNEAKQGAFTNWLQSHLKTNLDNDKVKEQIRELSYTDEEELESVIRRASVLVKNHSDDFEIPINSESENEQEVFKILLKSWNNYQQSSSGMGKAVIIKQAQPYSVLPVDGLAFHANSPSAQQQFLYSKSGVNIEQQPVLFHNFHISPLSGGTAIGAP